MSDRHVRFLIDKDELTGHRCRPRRRELEMPGRTEPMAATA